MSPFDRLIEIFRKFPGIGPRQARRFVYHLIRLSENDTKQFAEGLLLLKKSFKECTGCHRYFSSSHNDTLCSICSDKNRTDKELMIVSHDSDLDAIEKSGTYKGQYFVLGGTIPILEKVPTYIRERELKARVSDLASKNLSEIIIAMSVTAEGEQTVSYIKNIITPIAGEKVSISTLGRGVSTGSELEYADSETISYALAGRKKV